jgi:integrase
MSGSPRRAHGTGSLETRTDKYGREIYYGCFYVGGRQVKRKLGPKRRAGESTGLTKTGAERALQKLIDAEVRVVPVGERVDLQTAGERYLVHLDQVMNRRPTTLQDYTIMLRKHLVPFFAGRSLQRIDTQLIADYLIAKQRLGLKSKTVGKQLTFLHGVFRYAMKKGWTNANPVAAVDRPRSPDSDPDIRFLTHEELEALLRAVDDPESLGHTQVARSSRAEAPSAVL